MRSIWLAAGALVLTAGCTPRPEATSSTAPSAPGPSAPGRSAPPIMTGDGPGAAAAAPAPRQGGSRGGGMQPPPTPKPGSPLQPTPLKDKAIADAEKSGDKKAIAAAYLDRAIARQSDSRAHDLVRLPAARADLKKALEADPTNERAPKLDRYLQGLLAGLEKQAKSAGKKP